MTTAGTEKLYNGPIDCVRKIYRGQGLRGFFAGLAPTIGTRLVGSPVYFGTYEASKRFLHRGSEGAVRFLDLDCISRTWILKHLSLHGCSCSRVVSEEWPSGQQTILLISVRGLV